MRGKNHRGIRRREVLTGLMLILLAFSYIVSLVLDFSFVSPDATPQEDLAYLSESVQSQQISSIFWLVTALLTLAAIPFYLTVFRKKIPVLPWLNSLFMMAATAGFLMMARTGLHMHGEMLGFLDQGIDQAGEDVQISLLDHYSLEQLYRRLGSTCVGLWALGLGLSRFFMVRFPLPASVLLLISGPVLVFFNWYNPDHLARTIAMAGILIGVMVFCVRLINRGLSP
jgi:hypothetical protein